MRDATRSVPLTEHPTDSTLALLALRYAAGELDPAETEVFESRLGADQTARDALAEAVRLSAAASGLPAPTPDPLVREAAREQLRPTWATRLFPRRPYRGHPLAWAGVGGGLAAAVVAAVLPTLTADPPAAVTLLPVDQNSQMAFMTAIVDQPLIEEGTGNALASESYPPLNATDPQANPKLNPMRYEERSPLTGRMLPQLPSEPATTVTVPSPMPTGGPRAEVPTEQEAVQPMGTTEGSTKKG
jgi:hypothetical protein